jgi:hypothetical protein
VIPGDGVLVVASNAAVEPTLVANADFFADARLANGPGDALQLKDDLGATLDALQYGSAAGGSFGEGSPSATTGDTRSLARNSLGTDTNDNFVDFISGLPTPGLRPVGVPEPSAYVAIASLGVVLGFAAWRSGSLRVRSR